MENSWYTITKPGPCTNGPPSFYEAFKMIIEVRRHLSLTFSFCHIFETLFKRKGSQFRYFWYSDIYENVSKKSIPEHFQWNLLSVSFKWTPTWTVLGLFVLNAICLGMYARMFLSGWLLHGRNYDVCGQERLSLYPQ